MGDGVVALETRIPIDFWKVTCVRKTKGEVSNLLISSGEEFSMTRECVPYTVVASFGESCANPALWDMCCGDGVCGIL